MNAAEYNRDTWTLHLLQKIVHFIRDHQGQAYLVGGSVRNLLLHTPCNDWDIAITGDVSKQARLLANKLGGFYAHMHDKASRIVVKNDQHELIFDLSPIQGGSIEADLHQRDFTLNAIAIPLAAVVQHLETDKPLPLIDPLQGQAAITARRLQAVDETVFRHDPVRMLRAIRFMQRYTLSLAEPTAHLLTRDAALLTQAAPERIREELYSILQPAGATERLHFLDSHGLLTTLIPEFIPARGMLQPSLHHWDVLGHSLAAVSTLERLATTLGQTPTELQYSPLETAQHDLLEIQRLIHLAEAQGIFYLNTLTSPVMKMAALLHDIGKPTTHAVDAQGSITFYFHPQAGVPLAQQIMHRLRASTQERRLVQQVVAHHMRPGQLSSDTVTLRAIRRYFVDLGPTGISVALVSLADHLAMRGPEPLTAHWQRHLGTVRLLLTRYICERERIIPPRLLQPDELMSRLNLQPGPLIGQLLEAISEAQTEGQIHSKEDALWFAEEQLHQSGNDH